MKKVLSIHRGGEAHWVGDGFPVQTVFSYQDLGAELTPFLLLDHAGPTDFAPTEKERGVGWHPHRGFETVTVVYAGEVDHEDSAGNRGSIGPGDVQWMTAGSGVLHKELHSRDYARRGGRFEALQLWVNIPAKSKMTARRAPSRRSICSMCACAPAIACNSTCATVTRRGSSSRRARSWSTAARPRTKPNSSCSSAKATRLRSR